MRGTVENTRNWVFSGLAANQFAFRHQITAALHYSFA